MKDLNDVMKRLTYLKAIADMESDPFGISAENKEIKAIADLLKIFNVKWQYVEQENGDFKAVLI